MKTSTAPASVWEARLRWGSRKLSAEVLDGRGRTALALGDGPTDDIAIGFDARATLTWTADGLEVWLSTGVEGELEGKTISELVAAGRVTERDGGFAISLRGDDELLLRIGTLIVEVRAARGRFPRLPFDARALAFVALALLAVGLIVASVMSPPEMPRVYRKR